MITFTVPIPGAAGLTGRLDAVSIRVYDQTAVLMLGIYDTDGTRIGERRFYISPDSTPSWADYLAACPAAPNFRKQNETFVAGIQAALAGAVT